MRSLILPFLLSMSLAVAAFAEPPAASPGDKAQPLSTPDYYIEISIGKRLLTLYARGENGDLASVREFPAATAVVGLKVFPFGQGKVTRIELDPWWRPTAYTRQVFRERGIVVPALVPPGDRLNYMGAAKISLSHRTTRGNIYRIHGNNDPSKIGKRVTGGCIRLHNNDVVELAKMIRVGTEVNIVP